MSSPESRSLSVQAPRFQFKEPGSLLFMIGSPLSGKSTIAPLVASSIHGCVTQNMDIIRLAAQQMDELLPAESRDPFLQYGSCDSYLAIGNGVFTPEALVHGYRRYATAVSRPLQKIVPALEAQNASNVLFEGVQLLPHAIGRFLNAHNRLVVVVSDERRLTANHASLFGDAPEELQERYSPERLMLVQNEIINQARSLPAEQACFVDNTGTPTEAAAQLLGHLIDGSIITAW